MRTLQLQNADIAENTGKYRTHAQNTGNTGNTGPLGSMHIHKHKTFSQISN